MTTDADKVQKSFTISKGVADRLTRESEERMINPSVFVERALYQFLGALVPVDQALAAAAVAPTPKTVDKTAVPDATTPKDRS